MVSRLSIVFCRLTKMNMKRTVNGQQELSIDWDEEDGRPAWGPKTSVLGIKLLSRFDNLDYEEKHDIVQDCWLKGKIEKFQNKSKFSTYWRQVVRREAIDYIRKRDELRK